MLFCLVHASTEWICRNDSVCFRYFNEQNKDSLFMEIIGGNEKLNKKCPYPWYCWRENNNDQKDSTTVITNLN